VRACVLFTHAQQCFGYTSLTGLAASTGSTSCNQLHQPTSRNQPDPSAPLTARIKSRLRKIPIYTRGRELESRARGYRYSRGACPRLRVRERRIFLGMKNFFRLPPR